jgi:glycosyltransferase involved in cell wall biosynthesis
MDHKQLKFVSIFPQSQNVHLIKDVGMVPYSMYRFCGYDGTLVCYRNGEYPYLESEVRGLNIHFLKPRFGEAVDMVLYLLKNSRRIDVLNLYHFIPRSFFLMFLYLLMNRKGIFYLKTDISIRVFRKRFFPLKCRVFSLLFARVLKRVIISSESVAVRDRLQGFLGFEVPLIPNGVILRTPNPVDKKNTLLYVGRIGDPDKGVDILLNAFALCAETVPLWTLVVAGPVEASFEGFISDYFEKHPELKKRVILTGNIQNRDALCALYSESKVFVLPSRWESFGIVLVEALAEGCYLVTTDSVAPAPEITGKGRYGRIVPAGNEEALADALSRSCGEASSADGLLNEMHAYVHDNFSWEIISRRLDGIIQSKR